MIHQQYIVDNREGKGLRYGSSSNCRCRLRVNCACSKESLSLWPFEYWFSLRTVVITLGLMGLLIS